MKLGASQTLAGSTLRLLSILCLVAGCASSLSDPRGDEASEGASDPAGNDTGVLFGDGSGEAAPDAEGGAFDGEACAGQSSGAELLPAVLALLVDTSGSMDQPAPGARASKWQVTRRAVLDAVGGMARETALGLIFYPNVPAQNDPCFDTQTAVSIATLDGAGSGQRQAIQRAFQRQAPEGGTPTHDAYRYAVADVTASRSVGSRFIVLITDGVPTYSLGCAGTGMLDDPVDPSPLIGEASAAFAQGIRTFVIGSPGSEDARQSLSQMAEAGGTAPAGCSHAGPSYCHFDMTRESDLAAGLGDALAAISGVASSCQFEVPRAPLGAVLDPGKVNVRFTASGSAPELIRQSLDPACTDGWQYTDAFDRIRLCRSTCDRIQSGAGVVSLEFGCTTQVR